MGLDLWQWVGIVSAGFITLSLVGAIGRRITGPDPDERRRSLALSLAIQSHPEDAGAPADRCFTGRAKHFEQYLKTGRNDG